MNKYRDLLQSLAAQAGITINGPEPYDPQVNNELFYERVVSKGSLGLGESYMDGWWQCPHLDEFFFRVLRTWGGHKLKLNWRQSLALIQARVLNQQSNRKAVKVAKLHYNLSNAFFEAMLDKRMIYSCGYWKQADTLDHAQEEKLDLICRKLNFSARDRVLDIGCGWGGFLKFACERYHCRGVGITNSEEQVAYAKANCSGMPVEIIQGDYRDLNRTEHGEFDKVVSVGMFEHVGPKNYDTFMRVVNRVLAAGGLFLLHTIGNNFSRLRCDPWVNAYIFPNGVVPSVQQIGKAIEGLFVMEDWHNFGVDYARTLLSWRDNFKGNYRQMPMNTALCEDRFNRMWEYYLASFAGAFRARHLQLWQIVLSKGGSPSGYQSIR
jgi:cyclopropane-fatty-acyl-phospholipid synthase